MSIDDPHLVVSQRNLLDLRIKRQQGLAQRLVQRVHHAVAFRHGVMAFVADKYLHRRFANRLMAVAVTNISSAARLKLSCRAAASKLRRD